MAFIKHIIVACAVDSISAYTVRYAIELVQILKAKLTILHIVDTAKLRELIKIGLFKEYERKNIEQDLEREGKMFVERFQAIAKEKGVDCDTVVIWGTVHKQVAQVVKDKDANLLIIGGNPALCEKGQSTTGELILAEAPCPVLVVKKSKYDWMEQLL